MKLKFLIFLFILLFAFFTLLIVIPKENTVTVFSEGYIIKYQTYTSSFEVCGVSFDPPWFEVKDRWGRRILLVDRDGDLYIGSRDFYELTSVGWSWKNAFLIYSRKGYEYKFAFNYTLGKIRGTIIENANPSYRDNSLIIKDISNGVILAVFDGDTGDIIIRGTAVYHGGRAGCPYGFYCNIETGECI